MRYNFFYTRPQGLGAASVSAGAGGSDIFLSYKQAIRKQSHSNHIVIALQ